MEQHLRSRAVTGSGAWFGTREAFLRQDWRAARDPSGEIVANT
jgi:hypothetical protein